MTRKKVKALLPQMEQLMDGKLKIKGFDIYFNWNRNPTSAYVLFCQMKDISVDKDGTPAVCDVPLQFNF